MASNKKTNPNQITVRNFEKDSRHDTYDKAELRLVELKTKSPFANVKIRRRTDGYRVMVQNGKKNIPAPKERFNILPDVPTLEEILNT